MATYPSELLPSRHTVWHASAGGGYNFTPAITALGGTGGGGSISGLGLVDAFAGFGIFGTDIQFDTFRPKTQVTLIFSRTENRINIPHVLTRAEVESVNNAGYIELDLGEYVFDPLAVTDNEDAVGDIWQEILDESNEADELLDDYGQEEEKEDRQFRKLIERSGEIENNRLVNLVRNARGIEYRLDNGGSKATSIFSLPGLGDLNNPNYRDGSSRKITLNIVQTENDDGSPATFLEPGDIIYITYIAIKEHYIRQVVNVSWAFVAQSLPPQCYPIGTTIKAANYRFYEWTINNDDPQGLPILVSGWRAVESFNCPVNVYSLVPPFGNGNLAGFIYGPASGQTQVRYLPLEVTGSELDAYISNRSTLLFSTVLLNEDDVDGAKYSLLPGDEYKKAEWYTSGSVSTHFRYSDIIRHTFYNVHPSNMNKRDVDKFAIERSLASALETDVAAGKKTFVPFYDGIDDISETPPKFLDSSNTKFDPIQPVSSAFFAEMQCGTAGGTVLFPSGGPSPNGDVISFFQMESPIITERFANETRVIVERHFTTGQVDPAIVAIEGAAGAVLANTCIGDPSGHFAYAVHSHEGFLHINEFHNEYLLEGMQSLNYRPDQPVPLTENNLDPDPDDYEQYVGFTGMLGDKYGFQPGKYLSLAKFAPREAFIYKSTAKDKLAKILRIEESSIGDLSYEHEGEKLTIDLGGPGFYGLTEVEYAYTPPSGVHMKDTLLLFKSGSTINGVIDEIDFIKGNQLMRISHYWMQGSTIEINNVPTPDEMDIIRVTVSQLADSYTDDILRNTSSSSEEEAASNLIERLEGRSILLESDVMSIGEDEDSRLYVFFNDKENGISCVASDDFGQSWYFYYGIIEQIADLPCRNPFVVHGFERDKVWIFYQYMGGKIMCKEIDYSLFQTDDANLIEKTYDVVIAAENQSRSAELKLKEGQTLLVELPSKYTDDGVQLRRKTISYVAAGDLNDEEFLKITGRDLEGNTYDPLVNRLRRVDGEDQVVLDYQYPVRIGSSTAFTNKDIEEIYFSAYRKRNGEMKLAFLAPTKPNSDNMLQMRFSTDNGINWYDLWEYVEYGVRRLKYDNERKTQFIDVTSDGTDDSRSATDPQLSNQDAEFGVNIHWSRLKAHKIGDPNEVNLDSDSNMLPVDAPYLFYNPNTDVVMLFYIYEGCLLCKHFSDNIFETAYYNQDVTGGDSDETPMDGLKKYIEREIKAEFVDGELNQIKEEVHYFYNEDTNERLLEGNIVFRYPQTIDTFNSDRRIPVQRVCAYALKNGNIRVFYKNDNGDLKASIWDGRTWIPEDMMRDSDALPAFDFEVPDGETGVYGGFGDDKFAGEAGFKR